MSVEIPADFNPVVQKWISEGRFRDEGEVIAEGLRLIAKREKLHTDLLEGIDDLEAGRSVDGEAMFAELRALNSADLSSGEDK